MYHIEGDKESFPSSYPVLVYCRNVLFEQNRVDVEFKYLDKKLANLLIDNLKLNHNISHYDESFRL